MNINLAFQIKPWKFPFIKPVPHIDQLIEMGEELVFDRALIQSPYKCILEWPGEILLFKICQLCLRIRIGFKSTNKYRVVGLPISPLKCLDE